MLGALQAHQYTPAQAVLVQQKMALYDLRKKVEELKADSVADDADTTETNSDTAETDAPAVDNTTELDTLESDIQALVADIKAVIHCVMDEVVKAWKELLPEEEVESAFENAVETNWDRYNPTVGDPETFFRKRLYNRLVYKLPVGTKNEFLGIDIQEPEADDEEETENEVDTEVVNASLHVQIDSHGNVTSWLEREAEEANA